MCNISVYSVFLKKPNQTNKKHKKNPTLPELLMSLKATFLFLDQFILFQGFKDLLQGSKCKVFLVNIGN